MESDILVNGERISSLGIFRTFEKRGDAVYWHARDCAYKFLVVDGQLVIGAINDHSDLYAAWVLRNEPADTTVKERAETIAREQWGKRNWSVTGAGKISTTGQIVGWKSECFRVETPESARMEIAEEVLRLLHSGALTPG